MHARRSATSARAPSTTATVGRRDHASPQAPGSNELRRRRRARQPDRSGAASILRLVHVLVGLLQRRFRCAVWREPGRADGETAIDLLAAMLLEDRFQLRDARIRRRVVETLRDHHELVTAVADDVIARAE